MSTANLPQPAVAMLASEPMRTHHARWHFVRNRWHVLPSAQQAQFEADGWRPPRLDPIAMPGDGVNAPPRDPGAGLDFLYMHRRMIERLNALLAATADPAYPRVEGWNPIPWDHNDADWPMPPAFSPDVAWAKAQDMTDFFRTETAAKYESNVWLQGQDLDDVGAEIENGIHNWMHMHWASQPWFEQQPGQDINDPRNDYLGSTYASHVNKVFWKLHGWIDNRITQWETANNTTADFSQSWEGPMHAHPQPPEPGEEALPAAAATPAAMLALTDMERAFATEKFLLR